MADRKSIKTRLLFVLATCSILPQLSHAVAHRIPTYPRDTTTVSTYDQYCYGCEPYNYVIGLGAGPLFTKAGKTETVFLEPDLEKRFVADSNRRTNAAFELFLGVNHAIEPAFNGELGLAIALAGSSLHGHIWEDADPRFDDFTYHYDVQNTRYAAKGKFLVNTYRGWRTYLSGSAGVAVNTSHNFTISAIIPEAVPAPGFTSNTEMSFSYSLGVGIQHPLGEHWQVGAGYEFADWGKSSLGRSHCQTTDNGLGLSHLYTSEIVFFVNYWIPVV